MASLSPAFRVESRKIHQEHETIDQDLIELEAALDHLVTRSKMRGDIVTAEKVLQCGRRLATYLPAHCAREEALVFDTVADISPQLAQFGAEMKRQHRELLLRLDSFILSLGHLESFENRGDAIFKLKEEGCKLAEEFRRHIATEECELSGFL